MSSNTQTTDAPSPAVPRGTGTADTTSAPAYAGPVVARAGRYYRNARFLMVALCIGFACYFIYDGMVGYPAENAAYMAKPENQDKEGKFIGKLPHSKLDLVTQITLGSVLIPAGLAYLAFFLHRSRSAYQFDGSTVSIPGHPPFKLSEVTKLDRKLWDRKGIAFVEYDVGGKKGRARIDDFIYERTPTDLIYDAIAAEMKNRTA